MTQGKLQRKFKTVSYKGGIVHIDDSDGRKYLIPWEVLEIVEAAKAKFPDIQKYSHEPFEELDPEMIIEQFLDAYGFIHDILEWFVEYFGGEDK